MSRGLGGARVVWTRPRLEAVCDHDGAVPHGAGPCPAPGCGIYAMKDPAGVLGGFRFWGKHGRALGAVELIGRVVEHDRGYRAAAARAVAVAVSTERGLVGGTDAAWLRLLFSDPPTALELGPVLRTGSAEAWVAAAVSRA